MGLYSRGLIFEWFFCQQIIGLIFEGAYNRGGFFFCIHVYYHTTFKTLSTQNKMEDGGP